VQDYRSFYEDEFELRNAVGPSFYFLFLEPSFQREIRSARRRLWGNSMPPFSKGSIPQKVRDSVLDPLVERWGVPTWRMSEWLQWGGFHEPWAVLPALGLATPPTDSMWVISDALEPLLLTIRVFSTSIEPRDIRYCADFHARQKDRRTGLRHTRVSLKTVNEPLHASAVDQARKTSRVGRLGLEWDIRFCPSGRGMPHIYMRFDRPVPHANLVGELYGYVSEVTDWRDRLYDAGLAGTRRSPKQLPTLVWAWAVQCLVQTCNMRPREALRFWNAQMPKEYKHRVGAGPIMESGETQVSRERKGVRRAVDRLRED